MEPTTMNLPFPMPQSRDEHLNRLDQLLAHLSSLVLAYKPLENSHELDTSVRNLMMDVVGNLPDSQEGLSRSISQMLQTLLERLPVKVSDSKSQAVSPGSSTPRPNPAAPQSNSSPISGCPRSSIPERLSPTAKASVGSSSGAAECSSAVTEPSRRSTVESSKPCPVIDVPGYPTILPLPTDEPLPPRNKQTAGQTTGQTTGQTPDQCALDSLATKDPITAANAPANNTASRVETDSTPDTQQVDKGKRRAGDADEDTVQAPESKSSKVTAAKKSPPKPFKTFTALKSRLTTKDATGNRRPDFRRA